MNVKQIHAEMVLHALTVLIHTPVAVYLDGWAKTADKMCHSVTLLHVKMMRSVSICSKTIFVFVLLGLMGSNVKLLLTGA